jgi:hypothetical protein
MNQKNKKLIYLTLGILAGIALVYTLNSISNKNQAQESPKVETSECSFAQRKVLGIKPG